MAAVAFVATSSSSHDDPDAVGRSIPPISQEKYDDALVATGPMSSSSSSTPPPLPPPPPLRLVDVDPNERLPPPTSASYSGDEDGGAADLVRLAISSRHENSVLSFSSSPPSSSSLSPSASRSSADDAAAASIALQESSSSSAARLSSDKLTNILLGRCVFHNSNGNGSSSNIITSSSSNSLLLRSVLIALSTCDHGVALDKMCRFPKLHARLIHLIMMLDPFVPPDGMGGGRGGGGVGGGGRGTGVDVLREIDAARRERRGADLRRRADVIDSAGVGDNVVITGGTAPGGTGAVVKIAESSIRHKENASCVLPNSAYFDYTLCDAYLRLLFDLVSCNSSFAPPAIRSIWRLLTDFGGRWKEYMVRTEKEEREEDRRRRKRSRLLSLQRQREEQCQRQEAGENEEEEGEERNCLSSVEWGGTLHREERDALTTREGDRPVPGMGGLSVDFVRDLFCGDDCNSEGGKNDAHFSARGEEIYSDRLPSGRVKRLLLALTNIFRICPQSKLDLLREMSANFPHYKFCPRQRYVYYVHTCIQMVHISRSSFEGPVLALFVDRALDMDVEIKINDGGVVALTTAPPNAAADDNGNGVNDFAPAASSSSAAALTTPLDSRKRSHDAMMSAYVAIPDVVDRASSSFIPVDDGNDDDDDDSDRVLEISERLDSLMATIYGRIVLITTYDPNSLTSAMGAVVRARRLYRTHLEGLFERKVRTTDRTKFVQFIFVVLFGRENDALEEVGRLLSKREEDQRLRMLQQQPMDERNVMYTTTTVAEVEKRVPELTAMPASSDEPLYRGFIAKLIDYFYNPNYAGDLPRQTVVCYLASFVSRATYVCPETVCECLVALLRWAEVYISAQSVNAGGRVAPFNGIGGVRRLPSSASRSSLAGNTLHPCEMHALFYTCCQAAFYIFCFRGSEALRYYRSARRCGDDPEGPCADPESVDIGPERWKFLCSHSLQPLKYCLESVRVEFLNLAQDLNLFCDGEVGDNGELNKDGAAKLLEQLRNNTLSLQEHDKQDKPHVPKKIKSAIQKPRRSTIISTAATQEKKRLDGGVGGLGRGSNPLDSFFPFDPYLLQNSYEHVHSYFRNWEDCILMIEDRAENDGPIEEAFSSEDSVSEADHNDDEQIGDSHSDVSDLDDEEEVEDTEEEDSDDGEGDEDDHTLDSGQIECINEGPTAASRDESIQDDFRFEMEIRRSRAMSTGSLCSW